MRPVITVAVTEAVAADLDLRSKKRKAEIREEIPVFFLYRDWHAEIRIQPDQYAALKACPTQMPEPSMGTSRWTKTL